MTGAQVPGQMRRVVHAARRLERHPLKQLTQPPCPHHPARSRGNTGTRYANARSRTARYARSHRRLAYQAAKRRAAGMRALPWVPRSPIMLSSALIDVRHRCGRCL